MPKKDTLTEKYLQQEELVKAIKSNDENALDLLYQENYYKTEKYIIENSGSMEQAKDIYQEAFIAVWENVQNNKFVPKNKTALNGYLYTIAKNKWLDFLKSSRFKKTNGLEAVEHKIETEIETDSHEDSMTENLAKVMANFNEIGEGCKKILAVFYYEEKSLREIAFELNITEASARNKKYRCIEKLRALVLTSN
ncbi:RNA polymerase sigma factor [Maribacter sp. R77961]|uniref:RNA polymerase sigma factor n=1 Tax=Maribacter sp. R77961 TaxID=3093871 RepID=UPI0037CB9706